MLIVNFAFAQNTDIKIIDSLKLELSKAKIDTVKINLLNELSRTNFYSNPMEGMRYGEIALNLATKMEWKKGMAIGRAHV